MYEEFERDLKDARDRLRASAYADQEARHAVATAERRLAAAQGLPWAEEIDLGVQWDGGAPLPHIVANGLHVVLICLASKPDPDWDGSYINVVEPEAVQPLITFHFDHCHSFAFGGPTDESLHGHPLSGRGLGGYAPHVVQNSTWIASERAINSVHPHHSDAGYDELIHYFFVFHDEMFEALATGVRVESTLGVLSEQLHEMASAIAD